MSLLGEISKNSEALRYHAKTAEIAGKNLAHVNDETYARQRVLAREGVMYGSFGELQTSGLEAAGLDHARSELLDKRVVNELSETASLEARKEILDLLQGALGETITRSGINVGLDDLHDSDLAPGSLTRALNDFFNAFQELSASPDEPTIKQELFNKVGTLVKRFNDAGGSLDSIEEDLSETVRRSVDDVNRVLAQLHEVNKQVRRFELQDKGKAVTYRDRRQALLEELSQLMDFKVEEDVDPESGLPSGFINLYVQGSASEKVNLLDPMGPKNITNDWGQEFVIAAPSDPNGTQAKVRAKIDADGNLGRFEVLDGGSLYNDSEGPILVSLLPPKPTTNLVETETGEVVSAPKSGTVEEVFVAQGDEVKQGDPLVNVAVDDDETEVAAEANNVAVQATGIDAPVDDGNELSAVTGGSVANTVPFLSEVARMEGDVFYQGDAYYQALTNTQKGDDVSDTLKFMKITTWPNGQVQEIKKRHSDIESFQQGEQIYYEGKFLQATAEVSAISEELGTNGLASRTYLAGEVIKYEDTYFQAFQNLEKGTDLSNILSTTNQDGTEGKLVAGDQTLGSLWVIGQDLPSETNSKLEGTADENDPNSYTKGEIISSLGSNNKPIYYLTVADIPNGEVPDFANSNSFVRINSFVDSDVKVLNRGQASLQFFDDEVYYDEETQQHFVVDSSPAIISDPAQISSFDPSDSQWSKNFHVFKPKLNSIDDPTSFIRKISSSGHDTANGVLQEVNIGIAEAVVKNGEITTFNIINSGNSFPSSDAIFSDGIELNLSAGSIHGYQAARSNEMERFRTNLNDLVSNFVTKVNDIYNPDDDQGGYLFGFDAFLTRPVTGNNLIMEEEYGLYGVEGNGELQLFREEVNMTLPTAESDTFTIVNTTPIFPEEVPNQALIRESDELKLFLDDPNNVDIYQFYSSARRMQHVTLELDTTYPGEDKLTGTDDDGRSLLLGYETIPFRIEQGEKAFVIGDNFSFDAILQNDWNLATSLRVENDLTVENLKSTHDFAEGANDVAFAIGDLANEGSFTDHISTMNAD
ncbi:MAG: biotin/lipoyl-binding protein, partial [Verrucomicrobiota bacterium]|nr:biotin/lipoyl-binding protein [Verrucomicrobiota bacterium]